MKPHGEGSLTDAEIGWMALAIAALAFIGWLIPAAVMWVYDAHTPHVLPALSGTVKVFSHNLFGDPASAYPATLRAHMPTGPVWWWPAGLALAALATWATTIYTLLQDRRTSPTPGPSSGRRRGSPPRRWATPRDTRDLEVRRPGPDRFTLGRLRGKLLASDREAHVAVIAPTRTGKTTRFVIPWLLEHEGPAIVTSTKTDVLDCTRRWRERLGKVLVFDPFGDGTASWDPLAGCTDWSTALRRAKGFARSLEHHGAGASEAARYWRGEAAKLLAPMLLAAAYDERPLADVIGWVDAYVDTPHPKEVTDLLEQAGARAALGQLMGTQALDSRNRASAYQTAGSLLDAYRYPELQRPAADTFTAESFLDGQPNTLYIVAPSDDQALLAPTIVAMLSSIFHAAAKRSNRHGPLCPTLRALLDETANIAPLDDLGTYLSQAAGHGVRIATIWQSTAQIRHRYHDAAEDILANSTAEIYLGTNTDPLTIRRVSELVGDEPIETTSITHHHDHKRSRSTGQTWRPALDPTALQQLPPDTAILIEGRHPAAEISIKPWWKQRRLKRRGT